MPMIGRTGATAFAVALIRRRRRVELHCSGQRAVVGERYGVHAEFAHAVDQRRHTAGAVEERKLAVDVKVDESGSHR
jgi:hypothetical protein